MIQVIGLLIGVYVLARCVAEVTSSPDGKPSMLGRIAYSLCFLATGLLLAVLITSGSSTPRLR